jgi:hypothetical protein
MAVARSTLACFGCSSPALTFERSDRISVGAVGHSVHFHIRSSLIDMSFLNISAGASVTPT